MHVMFYRRTDESVGGTARQQSVEYEQLRAGAKPRDARAAGRPAASGAALSRSPACAHRLSTRWYIRTCAPYSYISIFRKLYL